MLPPMIWADLFIQIFNQTSMEVGYPCYLSGFGHYFFFNFGIFLDGGSLIQVTSNVLGKNCYQVFGKSSMEVT